MGTRKSGADRKMDIVAATVALVAELGPECVSTQAVANRVGITQAGLFRHFPTKNDLWLAVADWVVTEAQRRWAAMHEFDAHPLLHIKRLIEAQLQFIQDTPAVHSLIFSRELHSQNEGLRQAFQVMAASLHATLTDIIKQAQEMKDLPRGTNPQEIASLLLIIPPGLATHWSLNKRSFDLVVKGEKLLDILLCCLQKTQ